MPPPSGADPAPSLRAASPEQEGAWPRGWPIQEFSNYLGQYLRLAVATVTSYTSDVSHLHRWLLRARPGLQLDQLTAEDLRAYIQDADHLSSATVARRLNGFRAFFRFLLDSGRATSDPSCSIHSPKVPIKAATFVTDADLRLLLAQCRGPHEIALLLVFAHTGMRRSEVIALDVRDVDLDERRVVVRCGKGGKARTLPMVEELAAALRSHLLSLASSPTQALFTNRKGRRLGHTSLQRTFARWIREAGLCEREYTIHGLRHGAATRWLRAGMNLRDIQVMLGHSSLQTTALYCSSDPHLIAQELEMKAPSVTVGPPTPSVAALPDDVQAGLALLGQLAKLGQLSPASVAAVAGPVQEGDA